jgi:2-polyprenyl-6-methoxyphenol hydroxylase-like FAD-dependent oxidoreductase
VTPPRTLVVGAGIAGLALARALHLRGLPVEVVEQARALPTGGAGLYLPGNAHRALTELGLGNEVVDRAAVIERQVFQDSRGRVLADVPLRPFWERVGPCLGVLRRDLHEVLLTGVTAEVPVRLGTTLADWSGASPVQVGFTDGASDEYDLVVGADGLHSTVRREVVGDCPTRDLGQLSWRFLVHAQPGATCWSVLLGRDLTFLTVPVGTERTYCYADAPSTRDSREPGGLRRLFAGFGGVVPEILAALDPAAEVHVAPVAEVTVPRWTGPGWALVGDAAHATSPNMAQGAAMALEDGLVLAECLAGEPLGAALTSYERRRRARLSWVQSQTHRRDRTRALPPLIRNLVLRTAGTRLYRANYRPLLAPP